MSDQRQCAACKGKGLVLADLRRLGLGEGAVAFLGAGQSPATRDDGSRYHELVCPACGGTGLEGGEETTP